jgi:hypothetical protein
MYYVEEPDDTKPVIRDYASERNMIYHIAAETIQNAFRYMRITFSIWFIVFLGDMPLVVNQENCEELHLRRK